MKLSIITPNRNRDAYLEQLLGSVDQQRQDGIEFEHWVCDGGSTDGSLALLKRHHPKVRVITEKDSGPADAINKGMKAATGDILAWLDADAKAGPLRLDLRAAWELRIHPAVMAARWGGPGSWRPLGLLSLASREYQRTALPAAIPGRDRGGAGRCGTLSFAGVASPRRSIWNCGDLFAHGSEEETCGSALIRCF